MAGWPSVLTRVPAMTQRVGYSPEEESSRIVAETILMRRNENHYRESAFVGAASAASFGQHPPSKSSRLTSL
jgi:hypothetical protein